MHVTTRLYWLPKAGNRREEYEDAAWPTRALQTAGATFRCAVADGATESAFAGLWARQLVRWFIHSPLDDRPLQEQLAGEQARWLAEVQRKPLPWYAEEKAANGAFAALLGLHLAGGTDDKRVWAALAVGDCCLAQVREGAVVATFPATDAGFFSSRPYLISSHPQRNAHLAAQTQTVLGAWEPGDHFWLMTDALAHWLLAGLEKGAAALLAAHSAASRRVFAGWIAGLRDDGALRNDDVTLLAVTVDA